MIFNAILGLTGLALLGCEIALTVKISSLGPDVKKSNDNSYIAMLIIGAYITTILILGACSFKKSGVFCIFRFNNTFNDSRNNYDYFAQSY